MNLSHELSQRFQYASLESGYQEVSPQVMDQVHGLLRPVTENLAIGAGRTFGIGRASMKTSIANAIRSHLRRPL